MAARPRIVLLLLGLGVGDTLAAETPGTDAGETSPIFAVRLPAAAAERRPAETRAPTPVGRELTALLRHDAAASKLSASAAGSAAPPADPAENTLHLEKMTVETRRLPAPPVRETPLQKFTRTGYLWEFSPTKRIMIGPRGDKVGLMFSFDW